MRLVFFVFSLASVLFLVDCSSDTLAPPLAENILLRWVPAYEGETRDQVELGLLWSLSFLGADLPKGSLNRAIRYLDNDRFELNFSGLGFTMKALKALDVIVDKLKNSEEYQQNQAIDLGRFLVLTLHSSWHYYEITGVPKTLNAFLQAKDFGQYLEFAVTESSVSNVNRILRLQVDEDINKMAFVAIETRDEPNAPDYEIDHYETIDVQPNGQLRFAIYDQAGDLVAASPAELSMAGKPSKCLWCHETNIQTLFTVTPEIAGFISREEFLAQVALARQLIADYRQTLDSDLDFLQQQDHTQSELLYISFMEPSVLRTANEWMLTADSVTTILQDLDTHPYSEFPFLGALYFRDRVDVRAPYQSLEVPGSVREPTAFEPNFFD